MQSSITTFFKHKVTGQDEGLAGSQDKEPSESTEHEIASTSHGSSGESVAKKQKVASKFVPAWKNNRPWLKYVENEGMYCTYCQKQNKLPYGRTVWNTTPSTRLRLQTVKDHAESAEHKDSVKTELLLEKNLSVPETLGKPTDISADGMVQAFQCLYFLCKNDIAHTTNFPKLLNLTKLIGVDILGKIGKGNNAKYTSTTAIKEFLMCMSEVIETQILDELKQTRNFSLMFDETTDCSVIEQMVIHARFITKDGDVCVRFLKILDCLTTSQCTKKDETEDKGNDTDRGEPELGYVDVDIGGKDDSKLDEETAAKDASPDEKFDEGFITLNANTVCQKVTGFIESNGLQYEKLRGIGTDGAAVMTGRINGAVKKIIDRQVEKQMDKYEPDKPIPRAVGQHCAAHKLNLAVSHAGDKIPSIRHFKKTLKQLYAFYHRSAVRDKGLSTVQKMLHGTLQETGKVTNPAETRWLALGECAVKLKNILMSVLISLEREGEERADMSATGLFHLMTKFEFLATLFLLCNILPTINRLSRVFQTSKIDMATVNTSVIATMASLKAQESEDMTMNLKAYIDKLKDHGITVKQKLSLEDQTAKFNQQTKTPFIRSIVENLEDRFAESEIMSAFSSLFCPASYGTTDTLDPTSTASSDCTNLFTHLETLVDRFALPKEQAQRELRDFVHYAYTAKDYTLKEDEFLNKLVAESSMYSSMFPQLSELAQIYRVLPPHTADCERDFSRMKLIKSVIRNRMREDTLDSIMRITLEGPSIEQFPFHTAVRLWASKKDRRYRVKLT